ncbi:MAG: matrixin family metalloprotease [Parcubacteria group bacterium]
MNAKKIVAVSGIISLLIGIAPIVASSKGQPAWRLPTNAVKIDDDTYYLGTKYDLQSGKTVEGYAFLKHRDDAVRGGNSGKPSGKSACYSYLAKGAMWKVAPEPWEMNPANTRGLNEAALVSREAADIAIWEDATDGIVGNGIGVDVLGNGTQTSLDYSVYAGTLNGKNEVYFADISGNSVIAVTTVWGTFGGPLVNRELVEWDMVFDDVDFNWSLTGAADAMDFDNIATHELGHAFGLGHPRNTCTQETMYAFASNGETLKRDLYTGDITGINLLY